jgi:hypothetical protein
VKSVGISEALTANRSLLEHNMPGTAKPYPGMWLLEKYDSPQRRGDAEKFTGIRRSGFSREQFVRLR